MAGAMWAIYFAWAAKAPAVSESISFTRYKMNIDCYSKMQHTLSIAFKQSVEKIVCAAGYLGWDADKCCLSWETLNDNNNERRRRGKRSDTIHVHSKAVIQFCEFINCRDFPLVLNWFVKNCLPDDFTARNWVRCFSFDLQKPFVK